MKLKFVNQQYQTDAVNSIVNIFEGCEIKNSLFTIDVSNDKGFNKDSGYTGEGVSYFTGHANKVSICLLYTSFYLCRISTKNIKRTTN